MKITKALQKTAYHEAGHAVIAWGLGIDIGDIVILNEDSGYVSHRSPFSEVVDFDEFENSEDFDSVANNMILYSLAGPMSEKKFNPDGFDTACSNDDLEKVSELLIRMNTDGASFEKKVQEMINDPDTWAVIQLIANQVIEHQGLSRERVQQLLQHVGFD